MRGAHGRNVKSSVVLRCSEAYLALSDAFRRFGTARKFEMERAEITLVDPIEIERRARRLQAAVLARFFRSIAQGVRGIAARRGRTGAATA